MINDYDQFLKTFKSPKFQDLLPAQSAVLAQYASLPTAARDVAVELPTGAGKTLIALLIAEAWRKEGKRVAILSANKTLARQMEAEGQALGTPLVRMEGRGSDIPFASKHKYHRTLQTAVMNYWVYFNQRPAIDPADLLIMDDAHLAEHCLHSLYSVEINRADHPELFATLIKELGDRYPEYEVLSDALNSSGTAAVAASGADQPSNPARVLAAPTELLAFVDQVVIADRLREIIDTSPALKSDTDLKYRWDRLRHNVRDANVYMGSSAIWIRPYVYPLSTNPYYAQPTQVLYLSATVGEDGDLSRRLGVRKIYRIPIAPQHAATTFGRRLIVMNRLEEEDIPRRMQVALLAALKTSPKSLWLCSSEKEAKHFRQIVTQWLNSNGIVGHPSWLLSSLGDEIDQFRNSPTGHLFVAGRFDGMDFIEDQCRIVVLTTVPHAINLQEGFITAYLRDSGFMKKRLNQRIVQALGRCNRSNTDYALYLLADRRFPVHFGRDSNTEGIPSNILSELDLAQELAEIPELDLASMVNQFLSGNFDAYDQKLAPYASSSFATHKTQAPPETSEDEVAGWAALFDAENYDLASDHFERCWNATRQFVVSEIGALHGWHWAKSLFLAGVRGDMAARAKALDVLREAIGKGGKSSWFNRQRAALGRALSDTVIARLTTEEAYADVVFRRFDDFLERVGVKGDKFERWCQRVNAQLASDDHNQFQLGLVDLGTILGFDATRPKYQAATDCRWRGVFGSVREVVTFEAKIEHQAAQGLSASDVGQAHNQASRATTEFGTQGFAVRGTLVTHLTTFLPGAEPSLGSLRIIGKAAIQALWQKTYSLLAAYRSGWSLENIEARRIAAEALRPKFPKSGWLTRSIDGAGKFIEAAALTIEWV